MQAEWSGMVQNERYNRIIEHPAFVKIIKEIAELEQNRVFCGHGAEHLLAVARIGYIDILENQYDIPKDVMYGAALLHDIGRVGQYQGKGSHHVLGAALAKEILKDCGYGAEEISAICLAITAHGENNAEELLSQVLYRADKKSRNCFWCDAYDKCNWSENKKNRGIV